MNASCRGLTLMEVLATLAILAFALTALSHLQATLQQQYGYARQQSLAVMLAAERLATLRLGLAAGRTVSGGTERIGPDEACCEIVLPGVDTRYRRRWRVNVASAGGNGRPRLWRLEVTVSWQDRKGQDQSVTLYTLSGAMALPAHAQAHMPAPALLHPF